MQSESNNELKELDRFFADALKDAEVKPSKEVWKNIEDKLDEKSKKRFLFWLIPACLLFVGCGVVGYFFLQNNTSSQNSNTATNLPTVEKTETKANSTNNPKNNEPKLNETQKTNEVTAINKTETAAKKIQIAAFKNPNAIMPVSVAGMEVKYETGVNGVKKYFVETGSNSDEQTVLEKIKSEGFKDAFVINTNKNAKGENKTKNSTVLAANINHQTNSGRHRNGNSANENRNTDKTGVHETKTNGGDIASEETKNPESIPKDSKASLGNRTNDKAENKKPDEEKVATNSKNNSQNNNLANGGDNNPKNGAIPESKNEIVKNETSVNVTGKDTSLTKTKMNSTAANDTTTSEKNIPVKTESVNIISNITQKDSVKPAPVFKHFGLYLLAGPLFTKPIVTTSQQGNLGFTDESSQINSIGGLKLQYLISSKLAVELGTSYQKASLSVSSGTINFQKNLTNDTYVHTSYGDLTVDPATLMNGFATTGPFTNYFVKYSYKINYSAVNIPLLVKYYPVKNDKLLISTAIGVNSQIVTSQVSQIIIYKEFWNEVLNYNNIVKQQFNYSLMLALGCEIKLRKNIYFVFEPGMRYGLSNMNTAAGIKSKVFNFDGNTGIKIVF